MFMGGMSSPLGAVGCTVFVLSHGTGIGVFRNWYIVHLHHYLSNANFLAYLISLLTLTISANYQGNL